MPVISSDTLFHFTSKSNLLGILKSEFHPRFSLEHFVFNSNISFKVGIPMVCFCDIPLSLVSRHMIQYGNYGIGMSKEWASNNKLNPVLYLRAGSETTRLLNDVIDGAHKSVKAYSENGIEIDSVTEHRDLLLKLFSFTKPYVSASDKDMRYYDEREWRYVPDISSYKGKVIILREKEFKEPLLSEENDKLKRAKLSFEPSDINYIIINDDSERLDLIRELKLIKGKYDSDTQNILLSRIVSATQILNDF